MDRKHKHPAAPNTTKGRERKKHALVVVFFLREGREERFIFIRIIIISPLFTALLFRVPKTQKLTRQPNTSIYTRRPYTFLFFLHYMRVCINARTFHPTKCGYVQRGGAWFIRDYLRGFIRPLNSDN